MVVAERDDESSSSSFCSRHRSCLESMVPSMPPFRGDPGHDAELHVEEFEDAISMDSPVPDKDCCWPSAFLGTLEGEPLAWFRRRLEKLQQEAETSTSWDVARAAFLKRYPTPWRRAERLLMHLRQSAGQPVANYVESTRRLVESVQAKVRLQGGAAGVQAMAKARFVEGLLPECYNPAMEMDGVDLEQCFALAERAEMVSLRRVREEAAGVASGAGGEGVEVVRMRPAETPPWAQQFRLSVAELWDEVFRLGLEVKEGREEFARVKNGVAAQSPVVEREHKEEFLGLKGQVTVLKERVSALVEQRAVQEKQQASCTRQVAALEEKFADFKKVMTQDMPASAQDMFVKVHADLHADLHAVAQEFRLLTEKQDRLVNQERQLKVQELLSTEHKEELHEQEQQLAFLRKHVDSQGEQLRELQKKLITQKQQLTAQLEEQQRELIKQLEEQGEQLAEQREQLAEQEEQLEEQGEQLAAHVRKLAVQEEQLAGYIKQVVVQEEKLKTQEEQVAGYKKQLEQLVGQKDRLAEREDWCLVSEQQLGAAPNAPVAVSAAAEGSGKASGTAVIEPISATSTSEEKDPVNKVGASTAATTAAPTVKAPAVKAPPAPPAATAPAPAANAPPAATPSTLAVNAPPAATTPAPAVNAPPAATTSAPAVNASQAATTPATAVNAPVAATTLAPAVNAPPAATASAGVWPNKVTTTVKPKTQGASGKRSIWDPEYFVPKQGEEPSTSQLLQQQLDFNAKTFQTTAPVAAGASGARVPAFGTWGTPTVGRVEPYLHVAPGSAPAYSGFSFCGQQIGQGQSAVAWADVTNGTVGSSGPQQLGQVQPAASWAGASNSIFGSSRPQQLGQVPVNALGAPVGTFGSGSIFGTQQVPLNAQGAPVGTFGSGSIFGTQQVPLNAQGAPVSIFGSSSSFGTQQFGQVPLAAPGGYYGSTSVSTLGKCGPQNVGQVQSTAAWASVTNSSLGNSGPPLFGVRSSAPATFTGEEGPKH